VAAAVANPRFPSGFRSDTLVKLGPFRTAKIGASFLRVHAAQAETRKALEQFLISRFGHELYLIFFKSYTEKVRAVPCPTRSARRGAPSALKGSPSGPAVLHMFRRHSQRSVNLVRNN
jgi:protoporphyrinogen oxidase